MHRFISSVTVRPVGVALLAASLLIACGGGDGGGGVTPPPTPPGTLTLAATSATVALPVGASTTVGIVIVRGGSFGGAVTLSASGLPAGVSASFAPASLDAASTAATLTLLAGATAAAGNATVTISASGAGVSTQTTTLQLTITQPVITLAATPVTLSVVAGLQGQVTLAIGRSAGFGGAVSLALDNPPAGFSATFNASPTTAASATMMVAVATTVAPGTYPLSLRASAPGAQDKLATLTVTVSAALPLGFTLTVDPVEIELPAGRGWSANGVLAIQRVNGFSGPVTLTISSLGLAGVIGASPSTIAAGQTATNMLALALDGTAPGVYTATVRATGAGVAEQQATVRLRVALPSTGAIEWKFCNASRVPRFFAVRDGTGAWRHIVPGGPAAATAAAPATFAFSVSQATGAVAMVGLGEKTSSSPLIEGHHWTVYYMTAQELATEAARECTDYPDVTTRTATGSVTGYQSFDAVLASAAWRALASTGSTSLASATLSLRNLPAGPFDLMLTRSSFTAGGSNPIVVQQMALRRALDPPLGGALAPISFATDGFVPATGTVTFGNTNSEPFFATQTFRTAAGLHGQLASSAAYVVSTRPWYGVPTGRQLPGDLHQLVATTGTVAARRAVITFARDVATSRTLTFGAPLSAPSVTPGSGNAPWLVRAAGTLGAEYTARASVYLREGVADPRTLTLVATRGWLGAGSGYDVDVPDLASATGFTSFWHLRRGSPVRWTVTGGEGDSGGPNETFCLLLGICPVAAVDGATYRSAQATGTVTVP